jgi:undecaprenyl-diphosphatase
MLDKLIGLDQKIFLAINHFAASWADPLMRFISGNIPWILFFVVVIGMAVRRWWKTDRRTFLVSILALIVVYAATDLLSVHLFKEVFMRLRPCHEPALAGQVRLAAHGCGGQYGFVSSHAANSSGLAVLSILLLGKRWFTLTAIAWSLIICYSRIYLGVHYPGDILGGLLLGTLTAFLLHFLLRTFKLHPSPLPLNP